MDDKDLDIEDILANTKKDKKKVNGKDKGNRVERDLCKLLTDHFGASFSRSLGSGNRDKQVLGLPEHAKKTLSGDICVPEGFKWVIECKGGYEDDINLANALDGTGVARLDDFIHQVMNDADYCKRQPIICWKRNRKPWLAMIQEHWVAPLIGVNDAEDKFPYYLQYRRWVMLSLEKLLENTGRKFWFDN